MSPMPVRRILILMSFVVSAASVLLTLRLLGSVAALHLPTTSAHSVMGQSNTSPGMVDVIIHMDHVADLAGVMEINDAQTRRQAIIDSLRVVATDSQAGILNELENLRRAGAASH